jgi:hypothetical protein
VHEWASSNDVPMMPTVYARMPLARSLGDIGHLKLERAYAAVLARESRARIPALVGGDRAARARYELEHCADELTGIVCVEPPQLLSGPRASAALRLPSPQSTSDLAAVT